MPKTDITLKINQTRQYSGGLGGGVPVSVAAGGPSAANADTVDGYHASVYPIAGYLLALDGSALIPDAAIPATVVRTTRQVIAGNGLTGGGDLSADVTLNVGAGNGISVAADTVAVSLATDPGLEFSAGALQVKLMTAGGLTRDANGLSITTPAAVSATSTNTVGPNHTHAVTASSAPGAASALLKSDVNGYLRLVRLEIGASTQYIYTPLTNQVVLYGGQYAGLETGTGYKTWLGDSAYYSIGSLALGKTDRRWGTLWGSDANMAGTVQPSTNNQYNLGASGTRWGTVYGVVGDFSTQVVTPDITNAGNLTIDPAGDVIFNPTNNGLLPAVGYDLNIGSLAKKYLTLHAAELWVETLVAQNTIATIGGRILVGPTTTLTRDLAAAATTIYVKHNEMAFGDRVYMEASGKVEFMAITSGPTLQAEGDYAYTVTRDLDGSGANDWYAGDAVFNTGIAGEGFIDIYSVRGVKNAFQYGPAIVGNVRMSNTYNDWEEHWAIGQLNGVYGYSTNVYGVALGRYSPTAKSAYLTMDATSGLQIWSRDNGASVLRAKWDIDGNILIGRDAVGQSNVYITSVGVYLRNNTTNLITLDGAAATVLVGQQAAGQSNVLISSGALQLRNNTTVMIQLAADGTATFEGFVSLGTNGGIYQGTGTAGSPTTGLKIWRDSGIGRIAGYNSGTLQWYAGTDGRLYAAAGKFIADAGAVKLVSVGDGNTAELQLLGNIGDFLAGKVAGGWNSVIGATYMYVLNYASNSADMYVGAQQETDGNYARFHCYATANAVSGTHYRIDVNVGPGTSQIPAIFTEQGLTVKRLYLMANDSLSAPTFYFKERASDVQQLYIVGQPRASTHSMGLCVAADSSSACDIGMQMYPYDYDTYGGDMAYGGINLRGYSASNSLEISTTYIGTAVAGDIVFKPNNVEALRAHAGTVTVTGVLKTGANGYLSLYDNASAAIIQSNSSRDIMVYDSGNSMELLHLYAGYRGYVIYPLTTPRTSTSFDGDAFSDCTHTLVDVSAVFDGGDALPDGYKGLLVRLIARDSAAVGTTGIYAALSGGTDASIYLAARPVGGDVLTEVVGVVWCDANGDFYRKFDASGTGTLDVWITILGYIK